MMNKKASILLSIYKPNEEFLKKQLLSLNHQTYQELELIVWNDCPELPVNEKLFAECITEFPYVIYDEHINLGYAKAFEKLVTLATGEYICFCDQDDIWEKEKIAECIYALEKENGTVAVCDKSIIDENDNIKTESVRKNSNYTYEKWSTGDDITSNAVFVCHAPGMSMHARKSDVEKYIPFVNAAAHDRWLMAALSEQGKVVYVDKPLIRYRRYGKNASGILQGIQSKKEYYTKRCDNTAFINEFAKLFPDYPDLTGIIACNNARISGNPFRLFKYKSYIPDLFKYEFLLSFCPKFMFKPLVKLIFK